MRHQTKPSLFKYNTEWDGRSVMMSALKRVRRLRNRLWSWVILMSQILGSCYYLACITLTYASSSDWSPKDVSAFVRRLRAYFKRRKWRFVYFWVAELQQRGAVHYHVLVWVPRGHKLPFADVRGWWQKGMTHVMAIRSYGYIAKYLQKSGDFPKGLRLFGWGGLDWFERGCYRVFWLPKGLREFFRAYWGVFLVLSMRGRRVSLLVRGRRIEVWLPLMFVQRKLFLQREV